MNKPIYPCVLSLTVETDKTKGKEQEDWDIVTEEFSSTAQAYGRKPPSRLWKLNGTVQVYLWYIQLVLHQLFNIHYIMYVCQHNCFR